MHFTILIFPILSSIGPQIDWIWISVEFSIVLYLTGNSKRSTAKYVGSDVLNATIQAPNIINPIFGSLLNINSYQVSKAKGDSDVDDIVMLVIKKYVDDIFMHVGDMPIDH